MDLAKFTGTSAFGRAYQIMLERDTHASGSVDRVLTARMVRLCPQTAGYLYSSFTPLDIRYTWGTRPTLEAILGSLTRSGSGADEQLAAIVAFTQGLGKNAEPDPKKMRFGGTEEEIIERGSDWCTDIARVACVLCQLAGLPARIVNLFDLNQAYSGHVIIEAYRAGCWGALDSSTGIVYTTADGTPSSIWDLMRKPELIEAHRRNPSAFYSTPGQFCAAGIANYTVWESHHYDYHVAGINDYCLSILSMSGNGWPGGLRWLHGENGEEGEPRGAWSLNLPLGMR